MSEYTERLNRAGIPVWRPAQPATGREDEHQTALTQWARMMRTQYPALQLYHHIPNGGLRDKRTAARLIGQGVHSGVPDVFIPVARGGYHGIYVELKTGDNRPTPNQNEFMSGAMAEGYYCAVCYGWPCAAAVIEDYLRMPAADRRDERTRGMNMKYTIDYGFGEAILYTPYDAKERFYALAGTCFGIRKSIMHCVILRAEEIPCEDFERLEFNGDVYVWCEDGARKMIAPLWAADEEWNMDYCEKVRYKPKED